MYSYPIIPIIPQMGDNKDIAVALQISKGDDGSAVKARDASVASSAAVIGAILQQSAFAAMSTIESRPLYQQP